MHSSPNLDPPQLTSNLGHAYEVIHCIQGGEAILTISVLRTPATQNVEIHFFSYDGRLAKGLLISKFLNTMCRDHDDGANSIALVAFLIDYLWHYLIYFSILP